MVNRALGLTVYCLARSPSPRGFPMSDLMRVSFDLSARLLAGVALGGLLGLGLAGCKTIGQDTTGSLGTAAPAGAYASALPDEDAARREVEPLGERYRANLR